MRTSGKGVVEVLQRLQDCCGEYLYRGHLQIINKNKDKDKESQQKKNKRGEEEKKKGSKRMDILC